MLSKNQIKLITSLQQKKYRNKLQLFIVEGIKSINEFLASNYVIENLFYTSDYSGYLPKNNSELITNIELKKISSLKNPNQVLAIFKIPKENRPLNNGLFVALDDVKDPGNLGTIIRLCDWFNVKQLICSIETVDCYNSKVVQASMGSLTRVNVVYTDLILHLKKANLPVFIADMDGENVYKIKLPKNAILVMGNEASGISQEISDCATNKISIPRFGEVQETESLNVATATAVLLSEFKR